MPRKPILSLGPGKVAHLLGITFDCDQGPKADPEHDIAEMLKERLAGPLPGDIIVMAAERQSKDRLPAVSLEDVLIARDADLTAIRKIRKHAKKATAGRGPDAQYVAVTIYFAAIANAMLCHDVKITSYSYRSLEASLDKLSRKPWMPRKFKKLFTDAVRICRNKSERSQTM